MTSTHIIKTRVVFISLSLLETLYSKTRFFCITERTTKKPKKKRIVDRSLVHVSRLFVLPWGLGWWWRSLVYELFTSGVKVGGGMRVGGPFFRIWIILETHELYLTFWVFSFQPLTSTLQSSRDQGGPSPVLPPKHIYTRITKNKLLGIFWSIRSLFISLTLTTLGVYNW